MIVHPPFGCAEHDVHPGVPRQRADRPDVAVKPLLQVAIVDVLVHQYPETTSKRMPSVRVVGERSAYGQGKLRRALRLSRFHRHWKALGELS